MEGNLVKINFDSISLSFKWNENYIGSGISKITLGDFKFNYSGNWYGYKFYPTFTLKFNGQVIKEFIGARNGEYGENKAGAIASFDLKSSQGLFNLTFNYTRKSSSESAVFSIESYNSSKNIERWGSAGRQATMSFKNIENSNVNLFSYMNAPSKINQLNISPIQFNSVLRTDNKIYYKSIGGSVRLLWKEPAKDAEDSINIYRIYKNGQQPIDGIIVEELKIDNGYFYYDMKNTGDSDSETYYIQAYGEMSKLYSEPAEFQTVYKNTRSAFDISDIEKIKVSDEGYMVLSTGIKTVYFSETDKEADAKKYENNLLKPQGEYYFWGFDGLELSTNYQSLSNFHEGTPSIVKPKINSLDGFNFLPTTFTPYRNNGYNYITNLIVEVRDNVENHITYNRTYGELIGYYIKIKFQNNRTSELGFLQKQSSINKEILKRDFEDNILYLPFTAYLFFRTSLGEISEEKEIIINNKNSFLFDRNLEPSNFTITKAMSCNAEKVEVSDDLQSYYSKYIKMNYSISIPSDGLGYKNPTIKYGYSFGEIFTEAESENVNEGVLIDVSDTSNNIIPSIQVLQEGASSFVVKAATQKMKYSLPQATGNQIPVFSEKEEQFDYEDLEKRTDLTFSCGVIRFGGSDIKNGKVNVYVGKNPSLIKTTNFILNGETTIISLASFGEYFQSIQNPRLEEIIFYFDFQDAFGNSLVLQSPLKIDFRKRPVWESGNINVIVPNKVLNPGEEVQFSLPNSKGLDYKVIQTLIGYGGAKSVITSNGTGNTYIFTAPVALTTTIVKFDFYLISDLGKESLPKTFQSIGFEPQDLKWENVKSSLKFGTNTFAVGRVANPVIDHIAYKIDGSELNGTISFSDIGDSSEELGTESDIFNNYRRIKFAIKEKSSEIEVQELDLSMDEYTIAFTLDNGKYKNDHISLEFELTATLGNHTIQSIKKYLYNAVGATLSGRKNQVGINIAADFAEDSVFAVNSAGKKTKIYFISANVDKAENAYFNLEDSRFYNLIIDCGTWD